MCELEHQVHGYKANTKMALRFHECFIKNDNSCRKWSEKSEFPQEELKKQFFWSTEVNKTRHFFIDCLDLVLVWLNKTILLKTDTWITAVLF